MMTLAVLALRGTTPSPSWTKDDSDAPTKSWGGSDNERLVDGRMSDADDEGSIDGYMSDADEERPIDGHMVDAVDEPSIEAGVS